VSANHLAVGGARSLREFQAKLSIVYEEAAESAHWLSLLEELGTDDEHRLEVSRLCTEAEQLRNLFGRARATTRERLSG
jgi:four helix bundle protein